MSAQFVSTNSRCQGQKVERQEPYEWVPGLQDRIFRFGVIFVIGMLRLKLGTAV